MSIQPLQAEAFDVKGPLPTGITVLEASAGTGKTFTIAALAARYVAEGIPLDQLLLITFTRMATGELRERVRERLVSAESGLTLLLSGRAPLESDKVLEVLATGPTDVVAQRRDRLAAAVADFDAATIATTHRFCNDVLRSLGVTADHETDATLVEDLTDVICEVVDDLYVRRFHHADAVLFDRRQAQAIGMAAAEHSSTRLVPEGLSGTGPEASRVRLAQVVRKEVDARKRRLGILGYDDLLVRLNAALEGDGGVEVARKLQERYRVVLVDEFQDTDPDQWRILQRAFAGGDTTLVLIGDPKQAIYAFRGADVYAYLEAARQAGTQRTLDVNWRSDQGLIDAYDALLGGAQLGHPEIVYRQVEAAPGHKTPRLTGAPVAEPLRVRIVDRSLDAVEKTAKGFAKAASAREHIAADVADDIVRLLSSGAEIERRGDDSQSMGRTPVRPGHIAVLVQAHNRATLVRDALRERCVPAVINGAGSVFGSDEAKAWQKLLEAIERPESGRAHAAALTPFLGWDAFRVATASEEEWDDLRGRLHRWGRVLRERGIAPLTEVIMRSEGVAARMLAVSDGERRLTDLRHVAQLLHAVATEEHLGAAALTAWLRERVARAGEENEDVERGRRLESDDEAVQVLTVHRSKGLEYPVVYAPFLWEPGWIPKERRPVFFHDPAFGDAQTLDVGLAGPSFDAHVLQHRVEERGEDLRLMYVALTRARHQAVIWWAGSWDSRESPLSRVVFGQSADGSVALEAGRPPVDEDAEARFREIASEVEGCIAIERTGDGTGALWEPPPLAVSELSAAEFTRWLDLRWRRTSFSDITAGAGHDAVVGSEAEEGVVSDEPEDGTASAGSLDPFDDEAALRDVALPLGEIPGGTRIGTLVHEVLEVADFAAADLPGELSSRVAAARLRRSVEVDPDVLVDGLWSALLTPLGGPLSGVRLAGLSRIDRLDELSFELPLAGGDDPSGRLTMEAIASVLASGLGADDPLAGYAQALRSPALRPSVRGYLTGSIDLVMRLPGTDGRSRYAIADYKTNRLGSFDVPLTAWDYRPAALSTEMLRAHYGLQALLYMVALHRYLRWRVPDYAPASDLAGVAYLFLRGMTGEDGRGVWTWKPSVDVVERLSNLFDTGDGSA